jgi:hypothetical protein
MKKIYLLLFLPFSLFAQSQGEKLHRLSLSADPLSLIDVFSGPSYRLGLETRLCPQLSLYLEGGGYIRVPGLYKNVAGYTLKAELKSYVNNNDLGSYLSLAYFYKRQTYTVNDFLKPTNTPLYYTTDKKVHALTIKYGYVDNIKKRLIVDYFCGLGVRYKDVDCIGITLYEIAHRRGTSESEFGYFRDLYGISVLPNLDIGIRIGWILY